MYGDYWKLSRLPFANSCDPEFFFRGRSHEAALLKLQYVVEQSKGVALLTGEHGTGKTCVSRMLEAELATVRLPSQSPLDEPATVAPIVRLMFPRLTADEMLRYLVAGLTEQSQESSTSRDEQIRQLEVSLREHCQAQRRPTFLIDDAHLIDSAEVLQLLAQTAALSESQRLPFSLLLLGQPELLQQVQRVPALASRVAVRAALHPFSAAETSAYIRHRLSVAGMQECVFDDRALATFHQVSLGFPRRINQLCDLALLVGYADERPTITQDEVQAAAEELVSVSVD